MKSRKLWVLLGLTVAMITLNYFGTVTSDNLTDFLTWGYTAYATGNVASKFATKG